MVPARDGALAARTDLELGEALEPLLSAHRENIFAEARRLFPELAERPELEGALATGVDAVVYAMQGVALGLFRSDDRREREHLAFFERLALHELSVAGLATATAAADPAAMAGTELRRGRT